MEEWTVSTVYFDGRFWVALVERYDSSGTLRVGRHVFGPEPSNNDLLAFYRDRAWCLSWYTPRVGEAPNRPVKRAQGQRGREPKKTAKLAAQARSTTKAKDAYKELRQAQGALSSREARRQDAAEARARYEKKRLLKKERRRGH